MVKEVLDDAEPMGWESRYAVLDIRSRFLGRSWNLVWIPRSSNVVADLVAKFSLRNNIVLFADEFSFSSLPSVIVDKLILDQLESSL